MAAGGPEPFPVEPPPADDLDPAGPGGQAHESGPGPVADGGDLEGGGDHLVPGLGRGDGDQSLGQCHAAAGKPRPGQDAGRRPGGQGESGAVGGGGQSPGLQGTAPRAGHRQDGNDGAAVADRHRQGLEAEGRIRASSGPAGRARLLVRPPIRRGAVTRLPR